MRLLRERLSDFTVKQIYIELIALYVHPKNSNHLRSHLRAIMALDHSRWGLENKFFENKSGRIFCVRQVYFTKSCQQIWVRENQPFMLFIHHIWGTMRRCFYHTDLRQNAVLHNFSTQITLIQYSGPSKHAWAFNETVQKISKITYTASRLWKASVFPACIFT